MKPATATAVKEHGLIFSAEMVRALLDNRKSQTRRLFKTQPPEDWHPIALERFEPTVIDRHGEERPGKEIFGAYSEDWGIKCPYQVGDRIYVKETYCQKFEDGCPVYNSEGNLDPSCFWYAADGQHVVKSDGDGGTEYTKSGREASPWKSSMFMPKDAARIWRTITDVRAARVQDISEADAIAEGCKGHFSPAYVSFGEIVGPDGELPQEEFRALWGSLHGSDSWDRDWVFALSLKRIEGAT